MILPHLNRWSLFGVIGIAYSAVMGLTMLVDWRISGSPPNPLYYFCVPALATLFSAWLIPKAALRLNQVLQMRDALVLCFGIELATQLLEPLEKGLYAIGVPLTGVIYITFNFFLAIAAGALAFRRWGRMVWWKALSLAVLNLTLTIFAGGVVVAVTGVTAALP